MSNQPGQTKESTPLTCIEEVASEILDKACQCARTASNMEGKLFATTPEKVDEGEKQPECPGRLTALHEKLLKIKRVLSEHHEVLCDMNGKL